MLKYLVILLLPALALAAGNETINTLPNATQATFNSNNQTFLRQELPDVLSRYFPQGWVYSGGTHATAMSCTSAAFATEAFTDLGNHVQASSAGTGGTASINYANVGANCANPGSDTVRVAICALTGNSSGNWQRASGSNYFVNAVDTAPNPPTDCAVLMDVSITNGAITAVAPLAVTAPSSCTTLALKGQTFGAALSSAIAATPVTGGCVDARNLPGSQTIAATIQIDRPITLYLGAVTYTYAGASCAFDVRSHDVHIEGMGETNTVLAITGTAGTERGICSTQTVAQNAVRGLRFQAKGLQIKGTGIGASAGTTGTVGIDANAYDRAVLEELDIRNLDVGIRVQNPEGTGYYNRLSKLGIFYNNIGVYLTNGANAHTLSHSRLAGNKRSVELFQGSSNVIEGNTFEVAGGSSMVAGIQIDDNASNVGTSITGNHFEVATGGAAAITIAGAAKSTSIGPGNFYSSGHGDAVIDSSTCQCTIYLDPWGTLVTGGGIQGRTAPSSGIGSIDLIKNGSFEYDLGNDGVAEGWTETGGACTGVDCTWALDSVAYVCGARSQKVANVSKANPRILQTFTVIPNQPYVLSFWARATVANKLTVRFGDGSSETAYSAIQEQYGDNVWRHYYGTVLPTSATLRITIGAYTTTAIQANVDCMSLTPGVIPPTYEEPRQQTFTILMSPGTILGADVTKDVVITNLIGLTVGDIVTLNPTTTPTAKIALVAAWINTTNQLTVRWMNPSGGDIAGAAQNYTMQIRRGEP